MRMLFYYFIVKHLGQYGNSVMCKCTIIIMMLFPGTSLYLPEDEDSDMSKFSKWLQCYYKPGMKNVADHNKRTMWFSGDPGPLLPKGRD